MKDNIFDKIEIVACPLGGYKAFIKFNRKINVLPDETVRNSFEPLKIDDISVQLTANGMRIMSMYEYHLRGKRFQNLIREISERVEEIIERESEPNGRKFSQRVKKELDDAYEILSGKK